MKDLNWAVERLRDYLSNLEAFRAIPRVRGQYVRQGTRAEELYAWLDQNQDTIARIVTDLLADDWLWTGRGGWEGHQLHLVRRAIGVVGQHNEVEEHWPSGASLVMNVNSVHPWVWHAAQDLWVSSHWGEAVEAAVKVLNVKLQEKVGRGDLSGTDLVRQALSVNAPKGNEVRLRVRPDDGSDTYRSVQEGAMHLGEAVFMYWRNQLSHEPGKTDQQAAVEALGAISALARLVDGAEVAGG